MVRAVVHPGERLSMSRHAASITHGESLGGATHVIDRAVAEVAHGRFERSLAGLTALAAAVTTSEIYIEHYKASFGNKIDVEPDHRDPPAGGGRCRRGVLSKKWAKTALPVAAVVYTSQRPGWASTFISVAWPASREASGGASYNLPMGPPISAPGLMRHRGRHGPVGRAAQKRGLTVPAEYRPPGATCRHRIICPIWRGMEPPEVLAGCPASGGARPRK